MRLRRESRGDWELTVLRALLVVAEGRVALDFQERTAGLESLAVLGSTDLTWC